MATGDKPDVQRVNRLFTEIVNAVMAHHNRLLSKVGGGRMLTMSELHVIDAIGTELLPMSEIATRLGVTPGTITVAVDRLEKKGFLTRMRTAEDCRLVLVGLTPSGEEVLRHHAAVDRYLASCAVAHLSPEEQESLVRMLDKVRRAIVNAPSVEFDI